MGAGLAIQIRRGLGLAAMALRLPREANIGLLVDA